jgi:hypothetical protein
VISAVRVWLVAIGQWASDGSWAYNPMLCIENAEIAGTLIALSVPALKPVFGNFFAHLTEYTSSHTRSRSRSTKLRSHSKPLSGVASSNRDNKRLINWSKLGGDDYEMMPSEVSVGTRDGNHGHGDGASARGVNLKGPGIHVTNIVDITRVESPEGSRAS